MIRRTLTTDTIKALMNARVVNRIDYCNAVLAGVHDIHLRQLQGVLNAAARLIFCRRKAFPLRCVISLHWLPIHQRVEFKLCLIVFKCSHNLAPKYLSDYCQPVSSNPGRRKLLRLHVVTLLSHRQEQPITVRAVLPWQARPRGTQCLRRSMISSYLSPRSGGS